RRRWSAGRLAVPRRQPRDATVRGRRRTGQGRALLSPSWVSPAAAIDAHACLMFSLRNLFSFASGPSFWDFFQSASSYVVNVPVDRNRLWNQRMVADAPHVGENGGRIILHREPINELTFRRSGTFPDIAKAAGRELCGLEAAGKEISHHLVGEEQHAAVGVVDDEELVRAEQLVGDDQGA